MTSPKPNNNLRDQLVKQRRDLIDQVKVLRANRDELRGVSGTGKAWAEQSEKINAISAKIDGLNKTLGIPNGHPAQHAPIVKAQVLTTKPEPDHKTVGDRNTDDASARLMSGGLRRGEMDVLGAPTEPSKSVFDPNTGKVKS